MSNPSPRTHQVLNAFRRFGSRIRPRPVGGHMVTCPCHDDHEPSLSVSETEDGRILIKCFAGCSTEKILEAVGLTWADLGPDGRLPDPSDAPLRRKPEAVYDYVDEHGEVLFQVLRRPDKQFRQRRPDGSGGWIWNLNGVRRVLYRLPELARAIARGDRVFIVEGEKDVESLRDIGLVATTCPQGAGKWRPEYGRHLEGARVAVLPDNDEPGRKHAAQVAAALDGVAADVRVVELPGLPEKGDVSDWLEAGGAAEKLLTLADSTPPRTPPPAPADAGTCPYRKVGPR